MERNHGPGLVPGYSPSPEGRGPGGEVMPANNVWTIAFGDYEFAIDRKALTYRLVETKTGTVWADGLPVGSIEFEDRASGERQTVDFAACKLVSLSEKASAQGKRILFGLDWQGVPVDINFTCSQREIQLIVEASRDTRAHRVQDITLLPGLCSVPADGVSYLVLPYRGGAVLHPSRFPDWEMFSQTLKLWDAANGLTMPFLGAVRRTGTRNSALSVITDSAYAVVEQHRIDDGVLGTNLVYARDPERRRLDVRIVLSAEGDHVDVARSYRDKLVVERGHFTLRRKMREREALSSAIGAALLHLPVDERQTPPQRIDTVSRIVHILRQELGVDRAVCLFPPGHGGANFGSTQQDYSADLVEEVQKVLNGAAADFDPDTTYLPLQDSEGGLTRWDDLDTRVQRLASTSEQGRIVGSRGGCDWSAIACDFWTEQLGIFDVCEYQVYPPTPAAPLYAAVYHDSVISYPQPLNWGQDDTGRDQFLAALLSLSPPAYYLKAAFLEGATGAKMRDIIRRTYAVLSHLHRLSFSSFLNAHRFLTPDFLVEEARYTNGARVVINQSEKDDYVAGDLHLPPLGFYAEHPQMVAHDARRVGAESFPTRAWRIARSRDDRPLAESGDVLRQEFPVSEP